MDNDAALVKHINLERPINSFSAFLSATPRVGFWSLNATAGFEKQNLYLDIEDIHVAGGTRRTYYNKPIFTFNAFNTFSLKHDWRFDINFMFRSRGHNMNFYNDYDNCRLGFVVQKSFFSEKTLTLRVAVIDVLQRNRQNEYADMGYYQIQQNNRFSTHKLNFSVIYRFNTTRSKYKGTGAGQEAQERMKQ